MDDRDVLQRIQQLVSEEHELRNQAGLTDEQRERLTSLEVGLDQCWDLLRQRRALREYGEDPDDASVRPPEIVEKYLQ